jgi:hypothetical protein
MKWRERRKVRNAKEYDEITGILQFRIGDKGLPLIHARVGRSTTETSITFYETT